MEYRYLCIIMDYVDWTFNGQPFVNPEKYVGFCYCITHLPSGKRYLGRKYFWSVRKVKGKKRRQRSESNWRTYWSSSKVLQDMVKEEGEHNFTREIISLHTTRGDVNYTEVKLQFLCNVLESDEWINDNINGKSQRKPEHIVNGRVISETWEVPVRLSFQTQTL